MADRRAGRQAKCGGRPGGLAAAARRVSACLPA